MNTHYNGPYVDKIKPGSIVLERYFVNKRICKGIFCDVYLVIDLQSGEEYALKAIRKDELSRNQRLLTLRERDIHVKLFHFNIVRIKLVTEDDKYLFNLMEYAEGGELFNLLNQRDILSELEAGRYFCQVVRAVHYCHMMGIIHRDIKPENIFLSSNDQIKLGDFGWAIESSNSREICGTLEYMAPEVISRDKDHDYKIDIWSLGILLYEMLFGYSPFYEDEDEDDDNKDNKDEELMNRIKYDKIRYPEMINISVEARDLIDRMLDKNPKKRIDWNDLLTHSWVKEYWDISFRPLKSRPLKSLKSFSRKGKNGMLRKSYPS